MVAAVYCYRYKRLRIVLILGFGSLLIFTICMSTLSATSSKSLIWGLPVLFGIGWGASLSALVAAAQFSAPPDLM